MVFKDIHILVLLTKVALALEGLNIIGFIIPYFFIRRFMYVSVNVPGHCMNTVYTK